MDLSDVIAFLSLSISMFTFYWVSIRNKKALYLVRINSFSSRMLPEFAIINAGNSDILITSIICAFAFGNKEGWESPDDQEFIQGDKSFSINAGKTHHFKVKFPSKFSEEFVKDGTLKVNGPLELYHRDMLVIVEWVDSKGKEYKAESKIINYGFELNGHMTMSEPREKWHDLYNKNS